MKKNEHINKALFQYRKKVFLGIERRDTQPDNIQYIATILKNIEKYGFTFSLELIDALKCAKREELQDFYLEIVPVIKTAIGAHKQYRPMYPNFPQQVMDASDSELYVNAIIHYLGDLFGCRFMPQYEKEERLPLIDNLELTQIGLGTYKEYMDICFNLMESKSSISDSDKETIKELFKNEDFIRIPKSFNHKENLAFCFPLLMTYSGITLLSGIEYIKTATDILRIVVSLSGGDITLKEDTKFKKFSKKERRDILACLDQLGDVEEDMRRNKMRWIRLGEILHAGEYSKRFPRAFIAFDAIRNNTAILTYNSLIETALLDNYLCKDDLVILSARPGDFARRIDHLLRKFKDKNTQIIDAFEGCADKVATPVLLQVENHLKHRNKQKIRGIFVKNNKFKTLPQITEKIDDDSIDMIVKIIQKTLIGRFSKMEKLGKVYIEDSLKGINVPFNQRIANKQLNTIPCGSTLNLPDGDIVRLFQWWRDGKTRVDIDLGVKLFDTKWDHISDVTYWNLNFGSTIVHSGDITSAPNGASEFIDINIQRALEMNIRYVVCNIYSFTQQPYCDLPECFAGVMLRNNGQSGEIYEPKTVKLKFDIASDSKTIIPFILDLKDRKLIWCDLPVVSERNTMNSFTNHKIVKEFGEYMVDMKKTSLYHLFNLHASARGELVENKEDADIVFGFDGNVSPYHIDKILSEYLG